MPSLASFGRLTARVHFEVPAPRGGHIDMHNFQAREWRPAHCTAGIEPTRTPYDLRHTYAARSGGTVV